MTPGEENRPTLARMLELMNGYRTSQMIYVAARLQLADRLAEGPKSAEELATTVGAHAPSLHRLLRALASLGIFAENSRGRFELTPLSEQLRSDVEGTLRPFALCYGEPWLWGPWGLLLHSVRTGEIAFDHLLGQSLFEYLRLHPDAASLFNANMTAMTSAEAKAIVAAYDFSGTKVLVDVGGGHGLLATAVLELVPEAKAVLFDLPPVIESAREQLRTAGLARRCELRSRDFFESVPRGGDTYVLKDIIHDWDDERAAAILRVCRRALGDNAKLLLIERELPPGNEPAPGKLVDINMLVLTGGMERTEAEYRTLLLESGFAPTRIVSTGTGTSVIESRPA